jgi:hypothetical protein
MMFYMKNIRNQTESRDHMTQKLQPIRRYFFDCEFNENRPRTGKSMYDIDFISIGMISEDGEAFYAINKDCDVKEAAKHPWLAEHVVGKLPPKAVWKDIEEIHSGLRDYLRPALKLEFWARNNSYDVVTLCRIFGTMQALKSELEAKGVQDIEFRDINEFKHHDDVDFRYLPRKAENRAHAADYDAEFERALYRKIMQMKKDAKAPKL